MKNQQLNKIDGIASLCAPHMSHVIVDASAMNPHISQDAVVRPTNWLICYSFAKDKLGEYGSSLFTTPFTKFRAVYTRETNPNTLTCKKGIAVVDFNACCPSSHEYILLSLILIVFRSCLVCYNIVTSYTSPPMGTGGFEPARQSSASSSQSYCVCLLHHVPVTGIGEGVKLLGTPSPKSYYLAYSRQGGLSNQFSFNIMIAILAIIPYNFIATVIAEGE